MANDPKTREKIDDARGKLNGHVETAKQKLAEKKAKEDGESAAPATPPAAGGQSTPAASADGGSSDGPTYGEEGAPQTPKYGEEDGPKAA